MCHHTSRLRAPSNRATRIYSGNGLIERSPSQDDLFVHASFGVPLYLKSRGSWVFVSTEPNALQVPLPDVNALISDAPRDSDLAASLRLDALPGVVKSDLLGRLHTIVDQQAEFRPGDLQSNIDSRVLGAELGMMPYRWLLKDGKRIDVGLSMGSSRDAVVVDLDIVPRPGSELAKLFSRVQGTRTQLSALHRHDSLVNFSASIPTTGAHRRLLDNLISGTKDSLEGAIRHSNSVSPSDEGTDVARRMFHPLIDILETALARDELEVYLGLRVHRSGFLTVDLAMGIKNARNLEAWLRNNTDRLKAVGAFQKASLDLPSEGSANIHQVWLGDTDG